MLDAALPGQVQSDKGQQQLNRQADAPRWTVVIPCYNEEAFIGATLAFSIVGMIGCIGGAGGRYGEQRFLAATNIKEAAKLAAFRRKALGLTAGPKDAGDFDLVPGGEENGDA